MSGPMLCCMTAPDSTAVQAEQHPDHPNARQITFKGRTMWARFPNFTQLAAMSELADVVGDSHTEWSKATEAVAGLDRDDPAYTAAVDLVDSLAKSVFRQGRRVVKLYKGMLVDPEDYEWLQDGLASRDIQDEELHEIVLLVVGAFKDDPTAQATAAQPVKNRRARRKS